MNNELFSLKNIYKLLTDNEYPKISYPVIPKVNLKGLTLVRFWSGTMLQDFRNGRYGKMIFRTEGSRNRFFSQVCNRDESIKFYAEYAAELDLILDSDVLRRQSEMMSSFLRVNEFSFDVLVTKAKDYIKMLSDTDAAATAAVMEFFDKMLAESSNMETSDYDRRAKYAGYLIACLQIISLYGNEMEEKGRDNRIADLFGRTFLILMRIGSQNTKTDRDIKIITNRCSTLWSQPSASDRFFGRESEMFDLNEAAEAGGRYLISGHGGVGKTELMRRFMFDVIGKAKADAVAVISYRGNIADSLVAAFKWMSIVPDVNLAGQKIQVVPEAAAIDNANEIIAYLRSFEKRKLIIFFDDIDKSFTEDPLFEAVCDLPAVIFATSRLTRVLHFTLFKVDEPSAKDGTLIFRSVYGKRLTGQEKVKLLDFLNDSKWCHTQTLLLLARLAKKNGWSLDTLIDKADSMSIKSLQDAYKGMYSMAGMSETEKTLLTFIAWCPLGSMKTEFLLDYAPVGKDAKEVSMSAVRELQEYGWILGNDRRIEMRPFVAECVRKLTDSMDAFTGFKEKLVEEWLPSVEDDVALYDRIGYLTQNPTEDLLMKALIIISHYAGIESAEDLGCDDINLLLIAGAINAGNAAPLSMEKRCVYRAIMNDPTISRTRYLVAKTILILNYDEDACRRISDDPIVVEEMENCTVPHRLLETYMEGCTFYYHDRSEQEKSFETANWMLANSDDRHMRAKAYMYIASYYLLRYRFEEGEKCIEEGLKLSETTEEVTEMMLLKGSLFQILHRYDEALRTLDELNDFLSDGSRAFRIDYEAELSLAKGVLLRDMGEADRALKYIYKAASLKKLYNGPDSLGFKSAVGDLANAYEKAGHYDESERCYHEVINYFDAKDDMKLYAVLFKNNLSVLYVKMNEPEKAIATLDSAITLEKTTSPSLVAELYNNYSRAYDLLEDEEHTVMYAERSYPTLCELYGPKDPKCVENRARVNKYASKKTS